MVLAAGAVLGNSKTDIEAIGVVAEFGEDVPHRKAVLPSAHGDKYPIVAFEHRELLDRLRRLVTTQLEEVFAAEIRIVTANVDHGWSAADPALHGEPPEMTERTSTTASFPSTLSFGTRVPSSMTR